MTKEITQAANQIGEIEAQYKALYPIAMKYRDQVVLQLGHLIESEPISIGFPIQTRVKSWSSIAEKLTRKSLSLKSLKDLNDLVGLRLVLQFRRDVQTVCTLIESNFNIVDRYDTARRLKEDQFGYSSIHFVIKLPEAWLAVPTMKDMAGLKAEIQVRTLSQHIWAEASHTLQYKHEESVPEPVRRSISRVSALLETVDLELERVLKERDDYRDTLNTSSEDALLNVDIIERAMDQHFPAINKHPEKEDYSELLQDVTHFNIKTQAQFISILKNHYDKVMADDRARAEGNLGGKKNDKDSLSLEKGKEVAYYYHTGLARTAMKYEFGDKWAEYLSKKYEDKKPKPPTPDKK